MKRRALFLCALLVFCSALTFPSTSFAMARSASSVSSPCLPTSGSANRLTGAIEGANYLIEVPLNWNGTLLLYSHGYVFAGSALKAVDASDPLTEAALLQQGYALAGSSYSQNGWALQQAFHDQIALLDFFQSTCGHTTRTIPWGDSLGGIITAGLVQLDPSRFAGAAPLCGVLSGGIGTWNQALDAAFAFNVLLAGGALPVVHLTDPATAFGQASAILKNAQTTPEGRARIALFSALGDVPGWFSPTSPEPASSDVATQEQNQFLWQSQVDFAFAFLARAELEARAGGNPSWNIGVDYERQLRRSVDRAEVETLYQQAGLSLNHDLNALNKAQRIKPDLQAAGYLNRYITFNGDLDIPVLTMHTTGDGLVVNENEQSYAQVVQAQGDSRLLRQVFVHRANHCTFTPAENLTALSTLIHRLDTGRWDGSTNPTLMNQEAAALGSTLNIAPPAFVDFHPSPFLRPFAFPQRFS